MQLRQWTTPTLTLTVNGIDLTDCHIEVAFQQGNHILVKEDPPVAATESGCVITMTLSQEETGSFTEGGFVDIQIRYIDQNHTANATRKKQIPIESVIRKGVIKYEPD